MKIHICVPLAADDPSALIPLVEKAEGEGADFIEIRLDCLKRLEGIEEVVEHASVPLIATNRQHEQGGCRIQDEETRIRNLIEAAEIGFQYADIELTAKGLADVTLRLRNQGVKPIISFHDFKLTPSQAEMERIVTAEIESGAEICKVVTTANSIKDNLTCLNLLSEMNRTTKLICFAMGRKGVLSRALSPIFGAYFTYASLEKGMETAPGQITISELKSLYKALGVKFEGLWKD
ncbi:MAG: type I 3-dehydroquinate dehydratase [Candidatus Bathyarchaeia archaeon]